MAINKNRILIRLHRALGLSAALLVLVLALSGLALNHSETLTLDSRYLTPTTARAIRHRSAPRHPRVRRH